MRKLMLLLIFLFVGLGFVTAQISHVTGTVVSEEDGEPIVGASIVVKGTSLGTITDLNGKFSLANLPGSAKTLLISYIGMQKQEVTIKPNLRIVMKSDAKLLDEVVIAVPYGTAKKSTFTGSAGVVDRKLIAASQVSSVSKALQGSVAGLQSFSTSGQPGEDASIYIRGIGSANASSTPLYVVDGFPSSEGLNLNPNDIESMQILKDASATAIYGARGANGVVLITTKRGKAGENKISYSGYLGTQKVDNPFEFLNAKDYMNLQNALYQEIDGQEGNPNGVYTPSQLQSTVDTDWLDVCTRLALVQDHNIQFRGGSEKTKVLTSLGYYKQEGVLKNTDFNRISGRVNVDQTINDFIKAGATMYAHRERSNAQTYSGNILGENVMLSVMEYDPTVKPYNEDGTYGRVPGGRGDNPLANLLERKKEMVNDKFNGTAFLEVNPFDGFTAKATAGVELLHNFKGSYLPKSTTYAGEIEGGIASTYDFRSTRQVFEGILNYMKTFNNIHDLNVMLGYSYEKYSAESRSANGKGFSTDLFEWNNLGAASIKGVSSSKTENLLASFFGRVNYTFNDKYLATVTVRRDGSSRFVDGHRYGTFPSASVGWNIMNEPFFESAKNTVNELKLRASYGVLGNINGIDEYQTQSTIKDGFNYVQGGSWWVGQITNSEWVTPPETTWEKTKTTNIGVDASFLNSRFSVTADYFIQKTDGLLMSVNQAPSGGMSSAPVMNAALLENKGFELSLNHRNTVGEFYYSVGLNLSHIKNNLKEIQTVTKQEITGFNPNGGGTITWAKEGKPIGSFYLIKTDGIFQSEEEIRNYTNAEGTIIQPKAKPGDVKFIDYNGDGQINASDQQYCGNPFPKLNMGLSLTGAYKGIDLSLFFDGTFGNKVFNSMRYGTSYMQNGTTNVSTDVLNEWREDNRNTDMPRYTADDENKNNQAISDRWLENGSFFRLKTLELGYTLPKMWTEKIKLQNVRIYTAMENLFMATKYKGYNPDLGSNGGAGTDSEDTSVMSRGCDHGRYPTPRTFTFGLQVNF